MINLLWIVIVNLLFYPLNKKTIGLIIGFGETLLTCKKDENTLRYKKLRSNM